VVFLNQDDNQKKQKREDSKEGGFKNKNRHGISGGLAGSSRNKGKDDHDKCRGKKVTGSQKKVQE